MSRRYERMTVQRRSGKPVEGLERAGGYHWMAYAAAVPTIILGFILLVGGG